jgi:L-threonylcarbamoyladenylate synthase
MAVNVKLVSPDAVAAFQRCIAAGGVAVFPADTVYGLAADPESEAAVGRLYELKGRPPVRPAAVMFFALAPLLAALPELPGVAERLLPGGVTLLVPNPERRFPLACADTPEVLGVRVPALAGALAPLAAASRPVLQSSANRTGEPDARRLEDVDEGVRGAADLVLDGGELPGTPSTVVDLTAYERDGSWAVLREGAVPRDRVEAVLRSSR